MPHYNHVNYAYMWMDKANANKKRQLLIESNLSGTSNIVIIITFLLFAHVHFEIYISINHLTKKSGQEFGFHV